MHDFSSRIGRTKEDKILDPLLYIFFAIFTLSIIYPLWTVLMESVSGDITSGLKLLPAKFTLEAYKEVLSQKNIGYAYLNTIFKTGVGTFLNVIVNLCAAYTLSKKNIPLNRLMTILVVIPMFFGGGLIPQYLLIQKLNLIDKRWVLVLPSVFSGFYIMVARNFFYSIPDELEESAYIDGANELVIAFKICLPLSKPIIATIALWSAVGHWNGWFDPMIYISTPQKQVLQVFLRNVLVQNQISVMLDDPTVIPKTTPESIRSALLFVTTIPILAVYPFAQKYFISGIMTGAVKG